MTWHQPEAWLMDMDGVLVREEHAIPGADRFLARLKELGRPFMLLTNNSIYTQRDLAARLRASGLRGARGRRSGPPRWRPRGSSSSSGPAARRSSLGGRA